MEAKLDGEVLWMGSGIAKEGGVRVFMIDYGLKLCQ